MMRVYFKAVLVRVIFISTVFLCLTSHSVSAERVSTEQIAEILEQTRQLLPRKEVSDFLKGIFSEFIKISPEEQERLGFSGDTLGQLSETQFILLLLKNLELQEVLKDYLKEISEIPRGDPWWEEVNKVWAGRFRKLIVDERILEKFRKFNDPLEPLTLRTVGDSPAFWNLRLLVNHPHYMEDRLLPADDLRTAVIEFINRAKKEIMISVFDFDLMPVAKALVEARKKRGVQSTVLIDDKVIEDRPQVQAVVAYLEANQIKVVSHLNANGETKPGVNAVGLHHHKLFVRDWSLADESEVILSSANLTQSCMGPEGDLIDVPEAHRPRFSVPNANHMLLLDGQLLALVVHHELAKISEHNLRGRMFPLSGAIRLEGEILPGMDAASFLVIAFTPNGALDNVNRNFISRFVKSIEGPLGMMQFAFSSPEVEQSLLGWAQSEIKRTGSFEFLSVGDTPFAMMEWSIFLKMAGLEVVEINGVKVYRDIPNSEWREKLGETLFQKLRSEMIKVGPSHFGNRRFSWNGLVRDVSAKIHHKVLIAKNALVTGSFNFSKGAETNSEYIAAFFHPDLAEKYWGMLKWLSEQSARSIYAEAQRRNSFRLPEEELLEVSVFMPSIFSQRAVSRLEKCYIQMMQLGYFSGNSR